MVGIRLRPPVGRSRLLGLALVASSATLYHRGPLLCNTAQGFEAASRAASLLLFRIVNGFGRHSNGMARAFCTARAAPKSVLAKAQQRLCTAPRRMAHRFLAALPLGSRRLHPQQNLLRMPPFAQDHGAPDFFLFIKDYGWALRYRIRWIAKAVLDMDKPLQLDWVKLIRPVREPLAPLQAGAEIFNWNALAEVKFAGFGYQVIKSIGNGVEAVINLLQGRGISILVQPDSSLQLIVRNNQKDETVRPVTHCWVQCRGMPMLPIPQSISFYDLQEVVMKWNA